MVFISSKKLKQEQDNGKFRFDSLYLQFKDLK